MKLTAQLFPSLDMDAVNARLSRKEKCWLVLFACTSVKVCSNGKDSDSSQPKQDKLKGGLVVTSQTLLTDAVLS